MFEFLSVRRSKTVVIRSEANCLVIKRSTWARMYTPSEVVINNWVYCCSPGPRYETVITNSGLLVILYRWTNDLNCQISDLVLNLDHKTGMYTILHNVRISQKNLNKYRRFLRYTYHMNVMKNSNTGFRSCTHSIAIFFTLPTTGMAILHQTVRGK